jgi:hypothetical protein
MRNRVNRQKFSLTSAKLYMYAPFLNCPFLWKNLALTNLQFLSMHLTYDVAEKSH